LADLMADESVILKRFLKTVDWAHFAQQRVQWRELVNTALHLRTP